MTVTPNTVVVGVDPADISAAQFKAIQEGRGSPAAGEAANGYALVAGNQVSTAFALAVFDHESQMATDPGAIVVKQDTRNPGNCRSVRPASGARGVVIDTPKGPFVKYASWSDGWRDLAFRLVDPTYVYAQEKRTSIQKIIERFAPSSDGNNTTAYVNAVVADMNRWIERGPNAGKVERPPMTVLHSPRYDGYSHPREYLAFVDHIATGSKASNLSWLAGGSADSAQPSVNYYIAKNGELFEIVPYQHAPWTNGWQTDSNIVAKYHPDLGNPTVAYWVANKLNPNTGSITIEHEGEASDRLTAAQIEKNGWLKAWLHQETGIPIDRPHFLGHYQIDGVNRPYCPSFGDDEWAALIDQANARLAAQPSPPVPSAPPPTTRLVLPGQPGDIPFVMGFRSHLLKIGAVVNKADPALGALAVFGYALEPEWQGKDGNAYQETERYFLVFQPGATAPWDVIGLHRGARRPPAVPQRSAKEQGE